MGHDQYLRVGVSSHELREPLALHPPGKILNLENCIPFKMFCRKEKKEKKKRREKKKEKKKERKGKERKEKEREKREGKKELG